MGLLAPVGVSTKEHTFAAVRSRLLTHFLPHRLVVEMNELGRQEPLTFNVPLHRLREVSGLQGNCMIPVWFCAVGRFS